MKSIIHDSDTICLNAIIFFNLNLLILFFILLLVYKLDYIQNPIFYAFINFRSTYCFINITFIPLLKPLTYSSHICLETR